MSDRSVNSTFGFVPFLSQSPLRRSSPRKRDVTDIPGGSGPSSKVPRVALSNTAAPREQKPAIRNLRILAVKLQSHLKQDDISNLGYVMEFPETFDQSLKEHSNPVRFFIEEAERLKKITDQNFDFLIEVLRSLKLQAAAKVVEECKEIYIYGCKEKHKQKQERVKQPPTKEEKASKTAKSHWTLFQVWCVQNNIRDPNKASSAKISNYLKHLYQNKGLKVASIRGHLKSIGLFHDGFADAGKLKLTLKYLALTEKASKPESNAKA